MKKKKKFLIISAIVIPLIVIIIILIPLRNGLIYGFGDSITRYNYEMSFVCEDSEASYRLNIPILVAHLEDKDINGFESKFIENIQFVGEIESIVVNNSNYGKTLEIIAVGNISLICRIKANNEGYKNYIFSTRENYSGFVSYNEKYWISFNSSSQSDGDIVIEYHWGEEYYFGEGEISSIIQPIGWQLLKGEEFYEQP